MRDFSPSLCNAEASIPWVGTMYRDFDPLSGDLQRLLAASGKLSHRHLRLLSHWHLRHVQPSTGRGDSYRVLRDPLGRRLQARSTREMGRNPYASIPARCTLVIN